jgi:hypothetical protein
MGCDFPENVRAGAARTVWIGKLCEQTTTQHIENALFVFCGIPFCVQRRLTLSMSQRIYIQLASAGFLPRSFFQ